MTGAKGTISNKDSDAVRRASIKEKEKRKELHKQQIRDALQGETKNCNHVTFSDSDNEDSKPKKKNFTDELLGLKDVEESEEILEPRFKGKNTEKLLNLQSRYGNDSRFRLDDKFAEDSGSSEDEALVAVDEINDEAKRNMRLVDQIIGHVTKPKKSKPAEMFSAKSGQRYDPNTKNGMELEVTTKKSTISVKKKKATKPPPPDAVESTPDLTKFFDVSTDVLKNTFTHDDTVDMTGNKSHTFSFLESLKQDPDLEENNIVEGENTDIPQAIPMQTNPSDYDSSSDDEQDNHMIIDPPDTKEAPVTLTSTFFPKSASDPLIASAAENFCWSKTYHEMQKEWLEVKDILVKDYKKKHRDAMRKRDDNSAAVHQNTVHG